MLCSAQLLRLHVFAVWNRLKTDKGVSLHSTHEGDVEQIRDRLIASIKVIGVIRGLGPTRLV
jgi:hypothetical protein